MDRNDIEALAAELQAVYDAFEDIRINGQRETANKLLVPCYALKTIIDELNNE